jgi:TrmH family RNA methyltransferase
VITSLRNPRVKDAVRLRDRRHRQATGRILIDGSRELARAIDAGVQLRELFFCPALCVSPDAQATLAAPPASAEVFEVTEMVFAKMAFGDRAEGVLGVAEAPRRTLADLTLPPVPLVVVLDAVEKPGNVGAILRSADAAGVSAVVLSDSRTDLYNPNAIRASLGTIFTLPVAAATAPETLDWLRRQGLAILAARVEGSLLYDEADYRGPTALVLGSEAAGLSSLWSPAVCQAIRLPMRGTADSLNVSAAAAVLFYEATGQRRANKK